MTTGYQHSSAIVRMICLAFIFLFIQFWVMPNIVNYKSLGLLDYFAGSRKPESSFYPPKFLKQYKNRKIISFEMTGEEKEDKKILEVFRYEALKLKYTNDTSQTIRLKLHENTSYGTFIRLLDLMYSDRHRHYFEWDGYFYIIIHNPIINQNIKKIQTIYL